jgi:hypothetical protein
MFKRFSIHLALIFLFAFAQIGAVTHSISHVNDEAKHNKTSHSQQNSSKQDPSKQDSSTHSEQCTQCLSFAQIASGTQSQPFVFHLAATKFTAPEFHQLSYSSRTYTAYAARAPPQII